METIKRSQIGRLLQGGKSVFLPGVTGEPIPIIDAISANKDWSRSLHFVLAHVAGINRSGALLPHRTAHITRFFPDKTDAGCEESLVRASYLEIDSQLQKLRPEISVSVVSEPDAQGYCTFGAAADFAETSLEHAHTRIAIVNPLCPRIPDGPVLHIERFTHVVRETFQLLEAPSVVEDETTTRIAQMATEFIDNGASLQVGIGSLPNQVLAALEARENLRIHSGIASNQVRLLAESGALAANEPICCASYIGDAAFYRWLDGNQRVMLAGVKITHASETLDRLEKFVAINSALSVDLAGNVNAEWAGEKRISAQGGLPNFARGAKRSANGLSIIALPSVTRSGETSRIVARLDDNHPPTLTGDEVDIIVTENGSADLRGLSPDARAIAIAQIAAPNFTRQLLAAIP